MKKLLMGNEAFACAALEAGVGVVAGYPGTPSSEVIETIAARVADGSAEGVHVEWSTNEKAALEVVAGASYAGARTLFTCKQVGLNVASDALMSLNYVGVEGGCVLFVADDPGPISSQTEQDTRRFAAFAKVPVFDPATIEQGMEMIPAAFELSERYRTPVIVRATTRVCHSSAFVDVADTTRAHPAKGFAKDDARWVIFPARAYRGHRETNERLKWIEAEFSGTQLDADWVRRGTGASVVEGVGVNPGVDLDEERLLPAVRSDLGAWDVNGSHDDAASRLVPPCDLSRFNPVESGLPVRGSFPKGESGFGAGVLGIVCGGVSAAYAREALSIVARERATDTQDGAAVVQERAVDACESAVLRSGEQAGALSPEGVYANASGVGPLPHILMQIGTPFPFPAARASELADKVGRIVVFEELDHVIEDELVRLMGLRAAAGLPVVQVRGRRSGACPDAGENTVESIAESLHAQFDALELEALGLSGDELEEELLERRRARFEARMARIECGVRVDLPARPPVLCAGCPHRGAFYAAKRAIRAMRARAVFSGDIGCYTLGNARPLDAVDTCLCMGAGITMAQGLGVVEPGVKQLAFVGDSTFFASGLTGIANAAYNGHDITVCVLDNSTTAMTGGQPHPGIGRTLMGTESAPLSIEAALDALGVRCIEHANPHRLDESIAAVTRAVEFEGVSAVVFRAPCVNLVKPATPVSIDASACTGCKRCITSIGCPAIGFAADAGVESDVDAVAGARKRPGRAVVDPTLCVGCGLCLQVCPFDCINPASDVEEGSR